MNNNNNIMTLNRIIEAHSNNYDTKLNNEQLKEINNSLKLKLYNLAATNCNNLHYKNKNYITIINSINILNELKFGTTKLFNCISFDVISNKCYIDNDITIINHILRCFR